MDLSADVYVQVLSRLRARFGAPAGVWWGTLPGVVAELGDRWGLTVSAPVGQGNTSLVLRCARSDGSTAMLKLTPEPGLTAAENMALSAWASSGRVPAVWAADVQLGALLLEGIPNERPLSERRDPVAASEIAELIATLHRAGASAVSPGVESLAQRVEFIFENWTARCCTIEIPRGVLVGVERGRHLAQELASQHRPGVLVHGDLHPGNVLDGGPRGLVAIDPRPCTGDPAFDAVDWVFWNADPHHWHARSRELAAGLDIASERIWSWCTAFAALLAAIHIFRGATPREVQALLDVAA